MTFKELCESLEQKIKASYESGTTIEEAEKLAAEFLGAQMRVSTELATSDLDSRMRKSGVKAIRAAVYTDACSKSDKKPTESALDHILNINDLVQGEQLEFDRAEVRRDELERYYNIFREGHIYFRGIAKGGFNG